MYLVSAEFDSNIGKNKTNFTVESGTKLGSVSCNL